MSFRGRPLTIPGPDEALAGRDMSMPVQDAHVVNGRPIAPPYPDGFETLVVKGNAGVPAASYFHQLHHHYFECNYGENDVPFDMWFGTYHDGSPEAHASRREKRKAKYNILTEAE